MLHWNVKIAAHLMQLDVYLTFPDIDPLKWFVVELSRHINLQFSWK